MSRHTWWIERESRGVAGNYCLVVSGLDKNNWETVAEIPGLYNKKIKDYEFKNARLIAAAPELLTWTKELLTQLKIEAPNKYAGVIEHVEKLIAKAEGAES